MFVSDTLVVTNLTSEHFNNTMNCEGEKKSLFYNHHRLVQATIIFQWMLSQEREDWLGTE